MTVHDTVHGFIVEREVPLPELDAVMYQMKHEKTGLELVWISREEENKVFGIGFETLPWNDTGVFHILEHSVLCGSKNYPVKEPFVELLKNSMNTFLNAMTYSDKTMYPLASTNDKDFFNLMSVYMDGVFHPNITKERKTEEDAREAASFQEASATSIGAADGRLFRLRKTAMLSRHWRLWLSFPSLALPPEERLAFELVASA